MQRQPNGPASRRRNSTAPRAGFRRLRCDERLLAPPGGSGNRRDPALWYFYWTRTAGGRYSGTMIWLVSILLALFAVLGSGGPPTGGGVTIALDPPGADENGRLPAVTRARGDNPPLVVIDPSHGGRDPGAASPFGDG